MAAASLQLRRRMMVPARRKLYPQLTQRTRAPSLRVAALRLHLFCGYPLQHCGAGQCTAAAETAITLIALILTALLPCIAGSLSAHACVHHPVFVLAACLHCCGIYVSHVFTRVSTSYHRHEGLRTCEDPSST